MGRPRRRRAKPLSGIDPRVDPLQGGHGGVEEMDFMEKAARTLPSDEVWARYSGIYARDEWARMQASVADLVGEHGTGPERRS